MTERPDPPIRHQPPPSGVTVQGARPPQVPAPRERLVPKPLQRVIGFVILFSTVGVVSCQAFLD